VPPAGLDQLLRERQVHLAIGVGYRPLPGIRRKVLAQAALRLLVPEQSAIDHLAHFWRQGTVAERLIITRGDGTLPPIFQRGLKSLGVSWPSTIQVESAILLRQLVAHGIGVGLDLDLPTATLPPGVQPFALYGFAPAPLVAQWAPPSRPWYQKFLTELRKMAARFWTWRV